MVPMRIDALPERIAAKIEPCPTTGCWLWIGVLNGTGYGVTRNNGRNAFVHRVLYERLVGPIPVNLQSDHLCRNRACCNPDHIELVTGKVNVLRGDGPTARNARKTKCIRGHDFETTGRGWRICRTCERARKRRRRSESLAAGLCANCWSRPHRKNRTTCAVCAVHSLRGRGGHDD